MRWLAILALLTLPVSCAEDIPEHVELIPGAQDVEFATEPPSKTTYTMIGEVVGIAAANDPDAAEFAARNDLRNKAAEIGASLVTVDDSIGEAMPLRDKVKVKVYGRAFKALD
jgi:hypothetical protein